MGREKFLRNELRLGGDRRKTMLGAQVGWRTCDWRVSSSNTGEGGGGGAGTHN